MSDQTASREPELLTITEAAELLRAPDATPPVLAAPGHRPTQLPPRPSCALPPRRPPKLDRPPARRDGPPPLNNKIAVGGQHGGMACPSHEGVEAGYQLGCVRWQRSGQ